jgi:hypothetical protein
MCLALVVVCGTLMRDTIFMAAMIAFVVLGVVYAFACEKLG